MKKIIGIASAIVASASQAMAGADIIDIGYTQSVPEVSSTGSVAALAAVTAVGALAWERRRRNK